MKVMLNEDGLLAFQKVIKKVIKETEWALTDIETGNGLTDYESTAQYAGDYTDEGDDIARLYMDDVDTVTNLDSPLAKEEWLMDIIDGLKHILKQTETAPKPVLGARAMAIGFKVKPPRTRNDLCDIKRIEKLIPTVEATAKAIEAVDSDIAKQLKAIAYGMNRVVTGGPIEARKTCENLN